MPRGGTPTAQDTKAQLYGEYLHAFEDTFAHRNADNQSLSRFNTQVLIGHLTFGEGSDHTYNQASTSRVRDPSAIPGGQRLYLYEEWNYNELRTLQMEKEVFEQLQEDFADEIANNGGEKVHWRELAGDGNSNIGDPRHAGITDASGYRSQAVATSGLTSVLQDFNAFNPETHSGGPEAGREAKIAILNQWLFENSNIVGKDGKPIQIPEYNDIVTAQAGKDRVRILGGIDLGEHLVCQLVLSIVRK